ncbi:MAG TPA: nuclear transport factor 2 family protein [Streptosporangiaceae bacterium]|nr:nuclear transport factor 2 family protein [Streptosporangiaceae bacterium]
MADDEGQIRVLLADMEAGYRAKDAEQIVAHYAPDIVLYSLAPPLRTHAGGQHSIGGGRKADMTTADGVRTWLAGFGNQPMDYEIRDVNVAVGGDVAYAHGLSRMGSLGTFTLWFRFTAGLRKSDGIWQITHIHASVPFYMDETMKAAVDLAP